VPDYRLNLKSSSYHSNRRLHQCTREKVDINLEASGIPPGRDSAIRFTRFHEGEKKRMGNTYLILKSLHILGAVIFLGNIIVTGWWKVMADRTRNPSVIAFAQRQVTLTDYVFTAGGAVLLLATGLANAALHDMDYLNIKWLSWGYWLFIISGVIWLTVLVPVQIMQGKIARQFAKDGDIPEKYWILGRVWAIFGTLATIIPLANLYWMVFKPV